MNKYLISVDIEGITGVINKSFSKEDGRHYQLGCRYMTSDVNAVTQGIINADQDAKIIVRDSHGSRAANLDLGSLHSDACLIQGWGAIQNMLTGLTPDFTGVFLVGYHAGGHNIEAVLGHTMHSIIQHTKVNGMLMNETGLAAIYAGHMNVPVAFVSGDNHTIAEAHDQLGDNIVGVAVKESYGRDCAVSLSLTQARKLLEQGAKDAVIKLQQKKLAAYKVKTPITLEVKFYDTGVRVSVLQYLSEILAFDPIYKFNCKERTLIFSSRDALELLQRFNMIMYLVYGLQSVG